MINFPFVKVIEVEIDVSEGLKNYFASWKKKLDMKRSLFSRTTTIFISDCINPRVMNVKLRKLCLIKSVRLINSKKEKVGEENSDQLSACVYIIYQKSRAR